MAATTIYTAVILFAVVSSLVPETSAQSGLDTCLAGVDRRVESTRRWQEEERSRAERERARQEEANRKFQQELRNSEEERRRCHEQNRNYLEQVSQIEIREPCPCVVSCVSSPCPCRCPDTRVVYIPRRPTPTPQPCVPRTPCVAEPCCSTINVRIITGRSENCPQGYEVVERCCGLLPICYPNHR